MESVAETPCGTNAVSQGKFKYCPRNFRRFPVTTFIDGVSLRWFLADAGTAPTAILQPRNDRMQIRAVGLRYQDVSYRGANRQPGFCCCEAEQRTKLISENRWACDAVKAADRFLKKRETQAHGKKRIQDGYLESMRPKPTALLDIRQFIETGRPSVGRSPGPDVITPATASERIIHHVPRVSFQISLGWYVICGIRMISD